MPAEPQSKADATAPFGSFFELRRAHSELMRSVQDRAQISKLTQRIRDFMARAGATGAVLRGSDERDAAQNILDYWNASLLTMRGADRISFTTTQLEPVDESLAPDLSNKPNPYAGLRAFDEKSTDQFYGREEALRILLEKIKRHPIAFIIGPIGSGKSSLVMAGLLPLLAASAGGEEAAWTILPTVIPGTEPLEALLRAFYRSGQRGDQLDFAQWIAQQKSRLKRDPDAICDLIDLPTGTRSAVLVVDQFEEVFTLCRDPAERNAFVAALVALSQTTNVQFKILLIIREDMAEQSLQLARLRPFAQDLDARFSPPPPTRGELLQMITLPAKTVGLEFDEGIVDDLCKAVLGEGTALPLLQFTLSQLWAAREGNRVTWAAYRRVGRPREALRHTTERAYGSLSPEDQVVAKNIFLKLITPSASGIGTSIRRRVQRVALIQLAEPNRVNRVLEQFTTAGLIRLTPGLSADDDRFEIAHEALFANWPLLEEWLREERQKSERKLQVITTARLWQQSGHKPGYLPFGAALKEAERYADAAPEVRELVGAARSRAWRLVVTTGVAIVVLLSIIPLSIFFFRQYQERFVIPAKERAWNNTLKSTTSSGSEKAAAIRGLATNGLPIDLTRATLNDVVVNGIQAQGAKFIWAHLTKVRFESSNLSNAAFSQSEIVASSFDKTSLELSRFDGAMIADTSFSNADLYRTIFDRALFCQNVNFSMSDVRSASFQSVTFNGGHVPQFDGTAWWLAVGWSMQQIQSLAARPPGVNYKDSPAFKSEMQLYDNGLSAVPQPTRARARALNAKAWGLATYGVDLADAERLSEESVMIVRQSAEKRDETGSDVREEANNMDTLAYIQMQRDKMSEALENLKAAVEKMQGREGSDLLFRYALAQFVEGQRDEAIRSLTLAVDRGKYVPSHEMYLLRQHIKDEFLTNLESLMSKNLPTSAPPPATCPANSPG
jgi:Novel STAND NTPase 1/Pentapeptide repeats (9 copies)